MGEKRKEWWHWVVGSSPYALVMGLRLAMCQANPSNVLVSGPNAIEKFENVRMSHVLSFFLDCCGGCLDVEHFPFLKRKLRDVEHSNTTVVAS